MDVALSRLRVPAVDGTACARTTTEGLRDFCADDDAWQSLMTQLGASLAPPSLSPARTLGANRFYLGFETWLTNIDEEASYWVAGTEGDAMAADEMRNRFVSPNLTWSRVAARKGFPFGFELGGHVAHAYQTSYWALGVSLQLSPFEGFREGIGWLPDVAVRAGVSTMVGDRELSLTVSTLEVLVSKPLPIARVATFTPMLGAQVAWIFADSEVIDLTPGVDAFTECAPRATTPTEGDTGLVRCTGDPTDFNNNSVFAEVRTVRVRLSLGGQLRYRHFTGSASVGFDVRDPAEGSSATPDGVSGQWSLALGAGVTY